MTNRLVLASCFVLLATTALMQARDCGAGAWSQYVASGLVAAQAVVVVEAWKNWRRAKHG